MEDHATFGGWVALPLEWMMDHDTVADRLLPLEMELLMTVAPRVPAARPAGAPPTPSPLPPRPGAVHPP